jgi:hypothetical protein
MQVRELQRELDGVRDRVAARVHEAEVRERLMADLKCPITQTLMTDPCTCADGFSYERAAIEEWLQVRQGAAYVCGFARVGMVIV